MSGGRVSAVDVVDNVVQGRAGRSGQSVSHAGAEGVTAPFTVYLDADRTRSQDRDRQRRARAEGRRMERLGSDRVPADAVPEAARDVPLLSEAGAPRLRAVRQPRSISIRWSRRCRFRRRSHLPPSWRAPPAAIYTQGIAEDTKALSEDVLTRREFLQQAALVGDEIKRQYLDGARRVRRGPAVLLLREPRSGVAHDVAGAGSGSPRLRSRSRRALTRDVVEDLYVAFDRIVGRDASTRIGTRHDAHRDVRPRICVVAPILSPQQLAQRQRLSGGDRSGGSRRSRAVPER